MRNYLLLNYASNSPHNSISLEQVCFLEGVSYIFNQIRKKCTKLEKNIRLFVLFSAEKCTNNDIYAKSVLKLCKKINTNKYYIIHKFIFFHRQIIN